MFRWSMMALGITAGGLGCAALAEQQYRYEGGITYLVIAGVVVGVAAVFLPYCVERTWRSKQRLKAVILLLACLLAVASVFLIQVDRVHKGRSGADAERAANHAAVTDAEEALKLALVKAQLAEADAKRARQQSNKKCDAACLRKWDDEAGAARQRVTEARDAITRLRAKATEANPIQAPVVLLPIALDLIGFVSIWTALAVKRKPAELKRPRKRRKGKAKPPKAPTSAVSEDRRANLRVVSGR